MFIIVENYIKATRNIIVSRIDAGIFYLFIFFVELSIIIYSSLIPKGVSKINMRDFRQKKFRTKIVYLIRILKIVRNSLEMYS